MGQQMGTPHPAIAQEHAAQPQWQPASGAKPLPQSLYAYVWRVSGRAQIGIAGLSIVISLLDVVPLELQRRIVNYAFERGRFTLIVWLSALFGAVALAHGASKFALNFYRSKVGESAIRGLRLQADAAALQSPLGEDQTEQQGVGISIILAEVEPVGGFVGNAISDPVLHLGFLLAVFAYLLHLQPWMALVAIGLLAPQFFFVPFLQAAINRRARRRIQVMRRLTVEVVDDVGDQTAASAQDDFARRVGNIYRLNMEIFRRKYSMTFLTNLLHRFGVAGILLVGGYFLVHGRTEIGTVVAFISGLNQLRAPWGDIVRYFRQTTNARVKYKLIANSLNASHPQLSSAAPSV